MLPDTTEPRLGSARTDPPAPEPTSGPLTFEELVLAGRNRGMPLEALRYDATPTGLHYLLVHWDIPAVDAAPGASASRGWCGVPVRSTLADIRARAARTLW